MAAMRASRFREAERRLWDSVGAIPSERTVHLDALDTTVRLQELGEGPSVLFVHGASNAGSSWASLAARLPDFRCIMVDRPGCGLSDPIGRDVRDLAGLEAYADAFVPDVLDALRIDRASLVATSYGGYFALRAAAARPERVDRLVELGWTIGAPMATVPLPMRVTAVPVVGRAVARVPPTERAVRMILRQIGLRAALASGRFTPVMLDWFLALLRDTPTLRNELRATPRVILPIRGLNERVLLSAELLGRVRAPALFLWGADDPNGGDAVARAFVARVPGAELVMLPGVGHAPWIDEPVRVAARTRAFLGG